MVLWQVMAGDVRGVRYGPAMAQKQVDLPDPDRVHRMLAGWAAVHAAVFSLPDLECAFTVETDRVTYHDGGGSYFRFVRLPEGRAAIFGFDRDCPDDLEGDRQVLQDHGAEGWWLEPAAADDTLNFAYGYDGGRWSAVGHDPIRVAPMMLAPGSSQESSSALSTLADFLEEASDDLLGAAVRGDDLALETLLAAGPDMDEAVLRAAMVGDYEYLSDGLAAAALFRR
ncbi:hypothetical protein M2284_002233 [Rhodococcus sp. LBL1]|nr:hypothetical protein [Rhodococcus sp. LBL1]MDH6683621.1 hypothetical protein [Rhodococcus sp. LBL2]